MPTEDYILFADRRKSLSDLNKRMLFLMLPLVLLLFLLCDYFAHGFWITVHAKNSPHLVRHVHIQFDPVSSAFFTWFPWCLVAECIFLYFMVARSYKKQSKPMIVLSSEGIEVDTLGTHLGLIQWDEIEEIRKYTFIYRYIGIVPRNLNALSQRLGMRRAWLLRLNAACIPLYKPFGVFVAPINIHQATLSISADELLSRIQDYQAVHSLRGNYLQPGTGLSITEGVWPPPPRNEELH